MTDWSRAFDVDDRLAPEVDVSKVAPGIVDVARVQNRGGRHMVHCVVRIGTVKELLYIADAIAIAIAVAGHGRISSEQQFIVLRHAQTPIVEPIRASPLTVKEEACTST